MKALVEFQPSFDLVSKSSAYDAMTTFISANLEVVKEALPNFGKTQSQFMDNFLTVSHPTPLRNARQILAEINRILEALREAQYNTRKKELQIARLKRDLESEKDSLKQEEISLEIDFMNNGLVTSQLYIDGAVRSLTNYIQQYNTILKANNYDKMSEEDFEKEEEAYHIMKAFDQAICAARSRGGLVDEGNHIYFSQIGVNGAMAQNFITLFFQQEEEIIRSGGVLDGKFLNDFLKEMAKYFANSSKLMAELKGMSISTPLALLQNNGDTQ